MASVIGLIWGALTVFLLIIIGEWIHHRRKRYKAGYEHGYYLWFDSKMSVDRLREMHKGLRPKSPHSKGALDGVKAYLDEQSMKDSK